jgi:hypothetical protein
MIIIFANQDHVSPKGVGLPNCISFCIPIPLLLEIILLNGVLSVFAAYYFWKYGFLAAVVICFWADVVWHGIWGLF